MARPTLPGKRAKIAVLDVVIVIGGVVAIMAFNRMSIARLRHSLPNANNQIVGEWTSTRGPEHLVFRADKSVSMTVPANSAADNAASAAPETNGPAPVTGKFQVVQGGKVAIQLMNGNKYTTTINAGSPNRFDLIDSETEGVTTFERVPAAPVGKATTPKEATVEGGPAAPAGAATTPQEATVERVPAPPAGAATTPQEPAQ